MRMTRPNCTNTFILLAGLTTFVLGMAPPFLADAAFTKTLIDTGNYEGA